MPHPPAPAARYDGFADYYVAHTGPFARRGTPLLQALLGAGHGRCLELGCGVGLHLGGLGELGWRVVGLDVSTDQLRLARAHGGRRLVCADAGRLPFADASFEAVCAAFIHTDLEHWLAVVAEAARVVEPRGMPSRRSASPGPRTTRAC